MLCPYCLKDTDAGAKCRQCSTPLPPLYVRRRGAFSKAPAILSVVGFSGHGKTVYLAALLHAMGSQLTRVWPKFYRQALDIESVRTVQANMELLNDGRLPESTRLNFPRPSIHTLVEIPDYGTRDFLVYDPPGEAFNTDEGIESNAHFVQRARVVLFLVSLLDLSDSPGDEIYRLLNTYVLGMARMNARTDSQHLVVTLTKADRLIERFKDYPSVLSHLNGRDQEQISSPRKYVKTLRSVSEQLAAFAERELDAHAFMHLVRDQFKSVAFCAVSALGGPPEDDGRLSAKISPRRVADPLIWLLERS